MNLTDRDPIVSEERAFFDKIDVHSKKIHSKI